MNYDQRLKLAMMALNMEVSASNKTATEAELEAAAKSMARNIVAVRITHTVTDWILTAGLIALAAGVFGVDPFKAIFAAICIKVALFGTYFKTRSDLVAASSTEAAIADFIKGLK